MSAHDADITSERYRLLLGDCLQRLKDLPDNSVDSLVTDPPAGISFMGKAWDSDKGGSRQWINWMTSVMKECHRVLKPGAHGFVWALPRTSHWTAMACEWAGFEIRDVVTHLFGSGFPKSHDISKAIDKHLGVDGERKIVGYKNQGTKSMFDGGKPRPASEWNGWGTALKPASEHYILIRKPISEATVATNVLKHGTGAINIDDSRIGNEERFNPPTRKAATAATAAMGDFSKCDGEGSTVAGRFPANLVLSHNCDCELVSEGKRVEGKRVEGKRITTDFAGKERERINGIKYDNKAEVWACTEGCPIAILDGQSGQSGQFPGIMNPVQTGTFEYHAGIGGRSGKGLVGGKKDFGGASRFFYTSKSSRSERNEGLSDRDAKKVNDGRETPIDNPFQRGETMRLNTHPTVKPFKLMRYLVRMITPPGGTVLDCFMGSGSTGAVAVACGFQFIGTEQAEEYFQIAAMRVADVRLKDGSPVSSPDA